MDKKSRHIFWPCRLFLIAIGLLTFFCVRIALANVTVIFPGVAADVVARKVGPAKKRTRLFGNSKASRKRTQCEAVRAARTAAPKKSARKKSTWPSAAALRPKGIGKEGRCIFFLRNRFFSLGAAVCGGATTEVFSCVCVFFPTRERGRRGAP